MFFPLPPLLPRPPLFPFPFFFPVLRRRRCLFWAPAVLPLSGGGSATGVGGVSIASFFLAQVQVLVVVSLDPVNAGTVTGVALHRAVFFSGLDLTVSSGSLPWWFA